MADVSVVAGDDRYDLRGTQQPLRPAAATRPLPILFLNLDAPMYLSVEKIPEKGFNSNRPWEPPEPSRWDIWRPQLSEAEVQVKASLEQIVDRFLIAIFKKCTYGNRDGLQKTILFLCNPYQCIKFGHQEVLS